MHALIAKRPPEFVLQCLVGACKDEIDYLGRGVHDPKPLGVLRHRSRKERLVQLQQHLLARLRVIETPRPPLHVLVERLEFPCLALKPELTEIVCQRIQGPRNGVATDEVVALEQNFKHRPCQDVLRHHCDSVHLGDRFVDRCSQFAVEVRKPLAQRFVSLVGEKIVNSLDQAGEDFRDILRPVRPILAVATLVDDLGVQGIRRQVERRERQRVLFDWCFRIGVRSLEDDTRCLLLIEVDLIDLCIESVVV